jgi:hypothetical protein
MVTTVFRRDGVSIAQSSSLACTDGMKMAHRAGGEPQLQPSRKIGLDTIRKADIRFATTAHKHQILNVNQSNREHRSNGLRPLSSH